MNFFCTPADVILGLENEVEVLIADRAACEDWSKAVEVIARQYQMSYLNTRKMLIDFYRNQRVLSLYGICKVFYLAESAR